MANGEQITSRLNLLAYLGGLILAGGVLVAVGRLTQTVDNQANLHRALNERIDKLEQRLEESTRDRHTADDAARDHLGIEGRIARIERRVERLEDRRP